MSRRIRRVALMASGAMVLSVMSASPFTPAAAVPQPDDPVIAAVGDIACQSFSQSDGEGACRSDEVAALITQLAPDRFFALGDLQYNNGKLEEFLRVYDRQFGHLKPITIPAPGNHEYGTEGAQGYFDYFGEAAHGPEGYYSFDLGAWHVVSLNSDICRDDPGCGPGTPQYDWLAADLAGDRRRVHARLPAPPRVRLATLAAVRRSRRPATERRIGEPRCTSTCGGCWTTREWT